MTIELQTLRESDTGAYPRLGRHVEHDSRSRAYDLHEVVGEIGKTLTSVDWAVGAVLDQKQLGACVGFATAGQVFAGLNPDGLTVDQKALYGDPLGIAFYGKATTLDNIPGTYPPDDTGSSGIAGGKAAVTAGFVKGYLHAFSTQDVLAALSAVGPIMVGTNWYEQMFHPDQNGLITIGGQVAGGHEYLLYGIDVDRRIVRMQNSWNSSWGVGGRAAIGWDDLDRLLGEKGDATQFVPLAPVTPTPPAPVPPAPAPKPLPEDLKLATAMRAWARAKGIKL